MTTAPVHGEDLVPDVTVTIVTYNCRDDVLRCLDTLEVGAPRSETEVVVVDNDSRDDVAAAIRSSHPDVVFVERDGRRVHASPVWNTINLLREEESEGYNADQVWIVAPSVEAGRAVLDLARARWKADERRLWNRANSRRVAACVDDERVVSLWWD